jgi:hypothetical protein
MYDCPIVRAAAVPELRQKAFRCENLEAEAVESQGDSHAQGCGSRALSKTGQPNLNTEPTYITYIHNIQTIINYSGQATAQT